MNILITGINGFVGKNLVNLLDERHKIIGLDIDLSCPDRVTAVYSWNDLHTITDADIIIHLAGKAHDTRNTTDSREYMEVNVGLTRKIFDHFLKTGTQKFIFFSSVKAVADTVPGDELTEKDEPCPRTPYGISKLEAERYMMNGHIPENKTVIILRPCMIHGPGNKGNLNLLFNIVRKGIPYPLGAFENLRSFTSINNLAWVIERLMGSDIPTGIFNMADDEPVSTKHLVELISEISGQKGHIWNVNKKFITVMAAMGDALHLPLNSERLKKLTESYVVSNRKLKRALGVERLPLTAVDGLKATFQAL